MSSEEKNNMATNERAAFRELIDALIAAQSQIQHATKDGINPYFKSGYATLEQVITAVKEPLNNNGIYFQQASHESPTGACVETTFWGYGSSLSTGKVQIPADRNDAQAFGSALTYAKRYSLSMACGIGHQTDDDANSATFIPPVNVSSKPQKRPEVKQKVKPVTQATATIGGKQWTLEARMAKQKELVASATAESIDGVMDFVFRTIACFALPPEGAAKKAGDPDTVAGWIDKFTSSNGNKKTLVDLYNSGFKDEVKALNKRLEPLRALSIEEMYQTLKTQEENENNEENLPQI